MERLGYSGQRQDKPECSYWCGGSLLFGQDGKETDYVLFIDKKPVWCY